MQKAENKEDLIEKMFEVGAHYGYSKTRRHPSVSPYIYTTKNRSDIINLEKTSEMLEKALNFVKELASEDKTILFVGTKPEVREELKKGAEALGMPYVTERWIGGTLSNFTEIKKRIAELEKYTKEHSSGDILKYTKKERSLISKKMERLERYYGGVSDMKKLPDALFIIDSKTEKIAFTEARKQGIPVIALTNTDANIKNIDLPIVANDGAIPSINFFVRKIVDAYKK